MVEQLVVLKRYLVGVPVAEVRKVTDHGAVHQLGVAEHQQRLARLVNPEIPASVELVVERMHQLDERRAAHDGVGQVTEQRHRPVGVRHAKTLPLGVVVRQIRVPQDSDSRESHGQLK